MSQDQNRITEPYWIWDKSVLRHLYFTLYTHISSTLIPLIHYLRKIYGELRCAALLAIFLLDFFFERNFLLDWSR